MNIVNIIKDVNPCKDNSICNNKIGTFECTCEPGYKYEVLVSTKYSTKIFEKDGKCIDIDECQESQDCDFNCTNTMGSYHCLCS